MKIKNILITGAAGFIGRQLVNKLEEYDVKIFQIDDLSQDPLIEPHDNLIKDNVQNIKKEFLLDNEIDSVVHLAAKKNVKDSFFNLNNSVENYDMTLKLYGACVESNVRNFYIASTCEIYGFQNENLNENSKFIPHSPYAVSKVANEYLSDVYMMLKEDFKVTSLNFFNTYGPSEGADAVIPNFISKAVNNEVIKIEGDGTQARDFTYIDDTINLLINLIFSDKYYRSVNIGSGKDVSVNELLNLVKKNFKDVKYEYIEKRPNEIKTFIADNSLIIKEFNFKLNIGIEEGFKKVVDAYIKNNTK